MQVAVVQEHEDVAAQRHVDLSQLHRGEVILNLISTPQVILELLPSITALLRLD